MQTIAHSGPNSLLLKKDLKSAFRQVRISPFDWYLFLFRWRGKYYIDTHLPFGFRTSPRIYNLFAEAIHWVLQHSFSWSISHYVDDFLGVFPPSTDLTSKSQTFDRICDDFSFPTEPNKDEMGTRVNHLGFEVDTVSMTATLSKNKRDRAINLLITLIGRKSISAKTLENLLGFLNHCCEVVPTGRPFLRHLFNALTKANSANLSLNPYRYTRISRHAKRDALWWLFFLRHWSCVSIIQIKRPLYEIWTDASGTKGIGGIFTDHLFSAHVPRRHRRKHINWKEMYAILYAFLLWHSHWENGELLVHCDNEAVVEAINKRSIRGPTISPLQTLLLIAALFNITISAVWIPTALNSVADALFRHDFKRLANLGHQYNHHNVRNLEPLSLIVTLRQKLRSFLETASLSPPGKAMTTPSPTTSSLPDPMAITNHSPPPSPQSPTGSLTFLRKSKSKQLRRTSEQLKTTISSTPTPNSMTLSSSKSLGVPNESTTKIQLDENASHSPKTSSSKSSLIYETATSTTTQSIFTQHSVSDLPGSFVQANSPGINGILFHLLDFVYPGSTSPSIPNKVRSLSFFHRQRQTLLPKALKSTSHQRAQKSALLPPSTTSLNDSQPIETSPFSLVATALSHGPFLSTESKQHFSISDSTHPNTLATPSVKAPQSQQAKKDCRGPISNNSVDGKATQLTSTSTRFPSQIIRQRC